MAVSTNFNLIPYPDHNYQVLPYVQDRGVAHQDRGQESVEPHKLIRRPPLLPKSDPFHFDFRGKNYDVTRRLRYSDADQIGHLVDVYA